MRTRLPQLIVFVCSLVAAGPLAADESPPDGEPSRESLTRLVARVQTAPDFDDAQRKQAAADLQDALAALDAADGWRAQRERVALERRSNPERLEALQARPEVDSGIPPVPRRATVAELEEGLQQVELALLAARRAVAQQAEAEQNHQQRRGELRSLLASVLDRQTAVQRDLDVTPRPGPEAALGERVRYETLAVRRQALRAEREAYEEELLGHDVRGSLLAIQREQAVRRLEAAEARVHQWRDAVHTRSAEEAEKAVAEARDALPAELSTHPVLTELAAGNAALLSQRIGPLGLGKRIELATAESERLIALLERVRTHARNARQRVELAGLTEAVGHLLRTERGEIPDADVHRASIERREAEISRVQVALLDAEQQRAALPGLQRQVDAGLAGILPRLPSAQRHAVTKAAKQLLATRRAALDQLVNDNGNYFGKLVDLDGVERQIVAESASFKLFIDERVLWIRSAPAAAPEDGARAGTTVLWLFGAEAWGALLGELPAGFERRLPLLLPLFAAWGLALALRRRARAARRPKSGSASAPGPHTGLGAFLGDSARALTWPLLLAIVATWLDGSAGPDPAARAVATALGEAALVFVFASLVRAWTAPAGPVTRWLRLDHPLFARLHAQLRWLPLVLAPAAGLMFGLEAHGPEAGKASLGRMALLVAVMALAVFVWRIVPPRMARPSPDAPAPGRLGRLWRLAMLAVLFGLALASLSGYHYTAVQIAERIQRTLLITPAVMLAYAVLHRLAHQWSAGAADDGATGAPTLELGVSRRIGSPGTSADRIAQWFTIAALTLGLWAIWADVLPALRQVAELRLWSVAGSAEAKSAIPLVPGPSGAPTETGTVAVTLGHLVTALLTLGFTVVLARHLPPVLDVLLWRRLRFTPAGGFAVGKIVQYVVAVGGTVFALGLLGLRWSTVQWLAAAITVGLGFGLQEIFANFVSGLIILFERPIRPGDTVTVGEVSGKVSRIRMRATTIEDWDGKELIVPNRHFITERVVNWTLSDQHLRVVINVGVAYGSDLDTVRRVLLDVARACPIVEPEPAPLAVFERFGDSALEFSLRIFVRGTGQLLAARDQLNLAIDREFRAAGIEIPFPQRDIHIRTAAPGDPVAAALAQAAAPRGGLRPSTTTTRE